MQKKGIKAPGTFGCLFRCRIYKVMLTYKYSSRKGIGGVRILVTALIFISIFEAICIFWLTKNRKKEKNIDEMIRFFRDLWGKFVFYVLATSIIGLFLGSIFFKEVIGLDEINTWVGIVLGLVALVIGVISLFLSFYNVDQANKTQEKTVEIIQGFRDDMIEHMHNMQSDVERKIEESSERTRNEIAKFTYSKNENFAVESNEVEEKWDD